MCKVLVFLTSKLFSIKDVGPSPQERGSGSTSAVRPESMRRAETPDKLPPEDPEEATAKKKIVLDLRRTKSTENLHPKEHRYNLHAI